RGPDGRFNSEPLWRTAPGLIFTAMVADFDGNGTPDLLCATVDGLRLFRGSARGSFEEAGQTVWTAHPGLNYAQVLTCADFNGDGQLDLLVIGMNSPTADRLEHLGLRRPGFEEYDGMRSRMVYGNRLLLGRREPPGFAPAQSGDSLSRTGWSWGCSAFDY